jgi:DNA ligase (NAD+)
MTGNEAARRIEELSEHVRVLQHEYYVLNRPSVSDREYDRLFDELKRLEEQYPNLKKPDSPTHRVGSDLSKELPEVEHTVPVLSLDKGYTEADVISWAEKTAKNAGRTLSFVVEEKIDGVSIVLYYEKGVLSRAVTRGNGFVGNDVTDNVKTIGSVPLRLPEQVTAAVRSEIYLSKNDFERVNSSMEVPYANPRNLAAGTIRRYKSSEVARVPLNIFCYEGYFETELPTHAEVLARLTRLGFRVNGRTGFFSTGGGAGPAGGTAGVSSGSRQQTAETAEGSRTVGVGWTVGSMAELPDFIRKETEERNDMPYEIDGLVMKVNEIEVRDLLGYTGHHPRWAIAYKFEAPEGISTVQKIEVQVGRTGRVTPVARIEPVKIGGSTVSNVTLHNQEYISLLELAVGDRVAVSKRGDVIPAVERVMEKNEEGNTAWRMPRSCSSCGTPVELRGAHHFCPNREGCPAQIRGRLYFYIGTGQMDIDNLGPETVQTLIEKGFVKTIPDLYTADYGRLAELPGFGEKKIALIKEGLEKSKNRRFKLVLQSLGIPELGPKVAELLIDAGYGDIDSLFRLADEGNPEPLIAISGIGEKTARNIVEELSRPELRKEIEELRKIGLRFSAGPAGPGGPGAGGRFGVAAGPGGEIAAAGEGASGGILPVEAQIFKDETWCVTGSFEHFSPRSKAMEEVERRGGRTSGTVTGKTTHLLAGANPGSKLTKAKEVGAEIVTEEEFVRRLRESGWEEPS